MTIQERLGPRQFINIEAYGRLFELLYGRRKGPTTVRGGKFDRLRAVEGVCKYLAGMREIRSVFGEIDLDGAVSRARKVLRHSLVGRYDSVELSTALLVYSSKLGAERLEEVLSVLEGQLSVERSKLVHALHIVAPVLKQYPEWLDPFLLARCFCIFLDLPRDVAADIGSLKRMMDRGGGGGKDGGGGRSRGAVDRWFGSGAAWGIGEFAAVLTSVAAWRTASRNSEGQFNLRSTCDILGIDSARVRRLRAGLLVEHFLSSRGVGGPVQQVNVKFNSDSAINSAGRPDIPENA
ncbi:MAG: hypothetical protein ACTSU5_00835 [Promethearchaeota archaeon]